MAYNLRSRRIRDELLAEVKIFLTMTKVLLTHLKEKKRPKPKTLI